MNTESSGSVRFSIDFKLPLSVEDAGLLGDLQAVFKKHGYTQMVAGKHKAIAPETPSPDGAGGEK